MESLILWNLGSSRAEGKSRRRHERRQPGEGLEIFKMGLFFTVTIFLWPLAVGYRTKLLTKQPVIGWITVPLFAIILLIAGPVIYFFIGFFWAIGELTAYVSRNEDLFN